MTSNGYWNSTWQIDTKAGKLEGTVSLYAHLYEEGNIFFTDEKSE